MTLLQKTRYNAIVKETKDLLLAKGIDGVTMADIASHLSIGEASLYRYFGTKQSLVIEAAILIWQDVYEILEKRPLKSTGYENLKSFYGFFLETFQEHPEFFSLVEEFYVKIVQSNMSCEELQEYEETILKFKGVFDRFFAMGVADGTVKKRVERDIFYYTTNHALISLCKKLATQSHILAYETQMAEITQIQCLIDICLYYIKNT